MSPFTRHRKSTGETPEQTLARLNVANRNVNDQDARVGEKVTADTRAPLTTGAERVVLRPSRLARLGWPVALVVIGSGLISLGPGDVYAGEFGSVDGVVLGVLFVIGGLLWLPFAARCRVTLDPKGVTWRGLGGEYSAPWPDVRAVSLDTTGRVLGDEHVRLSLKTVDEPVALPGFSKRVYWRSPSKDMVRLVDAIEAWRTTYGF